MIELIKKIWQKILLYLGLKEENEVDYLSGGSALPEPLSIEEEREYVDKMLAGDENAKKYLIEHNLRLVVYIAKRFENTNADMDDLISVGSIGLIKAINSFDNTKQIKIATYASRCIENEILMHLRKISKTRGDVSLDEPLNVDWEGNTLVLSDVLGTDSDIIYRDFEHEAENEILYKSFDKLLPREKEIIKLRFGILGVEKKTQKEIADMLGISQSYISRLEKKVMKKLKREISNYEKM